MRAWVQFTVVAALVTIGTSQETVDPPYGLPDVGLGWLAVGDPGNKGYDLNELDNSTLQDLGFRSRLDGRGSVGYQFLITRSEITTGDWFEFVSRFSTLSDELGDQLRVLRSGMSEDIFYAGPGTRYTLQDDPLGIVPRSQLTMQPRHAMLYCNWLHNGRGDDPETLFDGAYDLATFDADPEAAFDSGLFSVRRPDARVWIPTIDEFLKAAYYTPDKNGSGPGWYYHPHASDAPPVYAFPPEGDAAPVGMPFEEYQAAFNFPDWCLPMGMYPDTQSPWGLIDVIAGNREAVAGIDRRGANVPAPLNDIAMMLVGSSCEVTRPFATLSFRVTALSISPAGFRLATAGPGQRPCSLIDYAPPFGLHSQADVLRFLELYLDDGDERTSILTDPVWYANEDDIAEFVRLFFEGCADEPLRGSVASPINP
ncbi:MAG: hypothetical protein AAFR38_14465 [Planctomycetota bacterium]